MVGKNKILVVDDDLEIRFLLSKFLKEQGFEIREAGNIAEFGAALTHEHPDLVVLDIMLPDGSGLDACRNLRKSGDTTPVILLTAVTDEVDRILGLEFGADDYVGKPFNPRELAARIKAVLRRIGGQQQPDEEPNDPKYRFDGFVFDAAQRSLMDPLGQEVHLTGAEFDLLKVFLDRPQRLISRETLLELTNKSLDSFDTTINVLMSRLRKKLTNAGASEEMFRTVRGGGYQLTSKVGKA